MSDAVGNAVKWAEAHPVPVAVGVVVVGLGVLFIMNQQSAPPPDLGAVAYFNAQAADASSADQVTIAQIVTAAQTGQAQIAADSALARDTLWAGAQVTQSHDANVTQLALAPYAVQSTVAQGLLAAASLPPITSTHTSNGINLPFGIGHIGGGTHTTTTPNPASLQALQELEYLFNSSGLHPST